MRSRTVWTRAVLGLVLLISPSACGDVVEPAAPSVTGQWAGQMVGVNVELTIAENSVGRLTGSGRFSSPADTVVTTATLEGLYAFPNISFTLTGEELSGLQPEEEYVGTVSNSGDLIDGALGGSELDLLRR